MDAELEFAIQASTTGKQLFDQVNFMNKCTFNHFTATLNVVIVNLIALLI